MFSPKNQYLRSKLAYSFLTVSPLSWVISVVSLYFTVASVLLHLSEGWDIWKDWEDWEVLTLFYGCIPCGIAALMWIGSAIIRWIPNCVSIPKSSKYAIAPHLGGCVYLEADSLFNVPGCPVVAYNVNNYVGGSMLALNGKHVPNMMAQFMNRYFNGTKDDPLSYDADLFMQCYQDERTFIFQSADAQFSSIRKLDKTLYAEPVIFSELSGPYSHSKPLLPVGSVIALHLPEGSSVPYAFFLCSTSYREGTVHPSSNLCMLELALRTMWRATDEVMMGKSLRLCLPLLGSGNSNMKEGKYSSIWTIVSTYRMAHLDCVPMSTMHLCIPPNMIRELDLREILKMMTYALCG